jgi:CubicO group peptidase (beta-lactamase class C family)
MKKSFFPLILLLFLGCTTRQLVDLRPPCAVPMQNNDDWEIVAPDKAGFQAEALCKALAQLINSDYNIHGILIGRKGHIVSEIYRKGIDHPISVAYGLWLPFSSEKEFNVGTLHDTRSISKSVISLALGILLQKKETMTLDTPALKFYPDMKDLIRPELQKITIRSLLSMSSGLDWDEGSLPNDETSLYWKKDQARFFFDRSVLSSAEMQFHYNSGGTAVLADIITRATGKPWLDFVQQNIFAPLEIENWEWVKDHQGRPLAFTGLRLAPRDMLKLGQMLLNHGKWKGRQIVPAEWIEDSFSPHISTGLTIPTKQSQKLEYGYHWWTGTVLWKDRNIRWNAAFGNGGQRLFIIPELEIVVVTTTGSYHSDKVNVAVNQLLEDVVSSLNE